MRNKIQLPQASGLLAYGAFKLKNSDPERSEKYLAAAVKTYILAKNTWETLSENTKDSPVNKILISPKLLFADIYIYKLTKNKIYREDMEERVKDLIECFRKRVYLQPAYRANSEYGYFSPNAAINLDFAWVPTFFIEEYPSGSLSEKMKESLDIFVKDIKRISSIEPWGQAMCFEKEGKRPARWPSNRPISYWSMLSYSLSRIGKVLNRPDVIELAERQIQWILGYNPFDISMVHGVGNKFVGGGDFLFSEPEFYNSFIRSGKKIWFYPGSVPTMAFRGVGGAKIRIFLKNVLWGPITGHPSGFPPMFIQPDYPIHPAPTEYSQFQTGNLCSGISSLAEAFSSMKRR